MAGEYDLFQSYSDDQVIEAVVDVLDRKSWWIKGPEVEALESAVADTVGCEHAVALNSGTSALFAALNCLDVDGREVILPSFTYQATPNAVVAAGGRPVFADIERESFGLDAADVRRKLTDEVAGIVPVHFGGDMAAHLGELRDIAEENGLFLLEDAAHSLGATYNGVHAGAFGDAGVFSFAFNKIITGGQGGMLVTDDGGLARRVKEFRVHGRNSKREYVTWGLNLVMSSIHAAIANAQMANLQEFISRREEMKAVYDDAILEVEQVRTKDVPEGRDPVNFLYNILLPNRQIRRELRDYLSDRGVPTEVYYRSCHLTEYYRREWGYRRGDVPVTEEIADEILTLPFHINLSDDDIEDIAGTVVSFFRD